MEIPPLFYVDRSNRSRLRLTGRDRQTFLQGMVSNDVARLQPGQGCYAFMLDATGHVLADMRVLCTEDSLLLDLEPGMGTFVAETLDKYLIMEKCRIMDVTGDTAQFFVGGKGAPDLFETLAVPGIGEWRDGMNGPLAIGNSEAFPAMVAVNRIGETFGADVYCAAEDAGDMRVYLQRSAAQEIPPTVLDALRIEAGIPRFGVDMDSRVLAPETGQEARAISYKKGCYIGQEIVARIDARGRVNRDFTGFWLTSEMLPAPETPVVVNGKEVGRVTSTAIGPTLGVPIALGYIRREHAEPGTPVTIADAPATVAELPFQPTTGGAN